MSIRTAACALLLCGLASGCTSLGYTVAEGKPAARLRITYDDGVGTGAQVLVIKQPLEANCRLDIGNIAVLANLGGSKNAMTNYEPAWTRDVRIAAGEPITLQVSTGSISTTTISSCRIRAKFEPLKDADYEMVFRSTPTECFLTLGRRAAGDGAARLVPEPIVDPSPQCSK